ncbi:hypothetical protein LX36DRAFT_85809 [Colletotrichum falcatum]|nr:hypothetical protein LX36DRAFT_85809 [Colletotrichum falcatum]
MVHVWFRSKKLTKGQNAAVPFPQGLVSPAPGAELPALLPLLIPSLSSLDASQINAELQGDKCQSTFSRTVRRVRCRARRYPDRPVHKTRDWCRYLGPGLGLDAWLWRSSRRIN